MPSEEMSECNGELISTGDIPRQDLVRCFLSWWIVLTGIATGGWLTMGILPPLPHRLSLLEIFLCSSVFSVLCAIGALGTARALAVRHRRTVKLSAEGMVLITADERMRFALESLEWSHTHFFPLFSGNLSLRRVPCVIIYAADGTPLGTEILCGIDPRSLRVWQSELERVGIRRAPCRRGALYRLRAEVSGAVAGCTAGVFVVGIDAHLNGWDMASAAWYLIAYALFGLFWIGGALGRWRGSALTRSARSEVIGIHVLSVGSGLIIGMPRGIVMQIVCGAVCAMCGVITLKVIMCRDLYETNR